MKKFGALDEVSYTRGAPMNLPYLRASSFVSLVISIALISTSTAAATAQPAYASTGTPAVSVWWPAGGTAVSGTQPFQAALTNYPTAYRMQWQVDGGRWNAMTERSEPTRHHRADVDVDAWTWRDEGPYRVTFRALSSSGVEIARASADVRIGTAAAQPSPPPAPTPAPAPAPAPATTATLAGAKLYVNPASSAARQALAWTATRPADAEAMRRIANGAQATWLGGWNSDVEAAARSAASAASAAGAMPTLVVYNIPQRDCGGYSSGGLTSAAAYRDWIARIVRGLGATRSAIILEPDALPLMDCLTADGKRARTAMLAEAVATLAGKGHAVYLDAGHASWIGADEMARRLAAANVAQAAGFSLNVSNFRTTPDSIAYGTALSSRTGGKRFVIDTSRNGAGPLGSEWCNPSGRKLGNLPSTRTGVPLVDAYLWIKAPGESDGTCNGGPAAGAWWPSYALGLAR